MVRQYEKLGELLTGFDAKNTYAILDGAGSRLYFAAEEACSTLIRWLMKGQPPFPIAVMTEDGEKILRVVRPFCFYFQQAEVMDAQGQSLGIIKRRFSFLRRIYTVCDRCGAELYQLFGPLLRPWTFQIKKAGVEQGTITKKWSGLLKEGFTDADTFGMTEPADWDVKVKVL